MAATSVASAAGSRVSGRRPEDPAEVVGGEQVLHRDRVRLGQGGDRRRGRGPAGGPRRGRAPPRHGGAAGRRCAGLRAGRSASSSAAARLSGSHPAGGVALRATSVEALGREQLGLVRRGRRVAATTIAASGMIRPGVTSRLAAISSRVSHSSLTAPRPRRPRTRCSPDVRRQASTRGVGTKSRRRLELLARPVELAGLDQLGVQRVAQLDQHLDVQGGVLQPGCGQRAGRPVDGRVLLLHPVAEHRLDERGQARPAGGRAGGRPARCRTARSASARPRPGRAGPGSRRAGSTRCPRAPSAAGPAWTARSGR